MLTTKGGAHRDPGRFAPRLGSAVGGGVLGFSIVHWPFGLIAALVGALAGVVGGFCAACLAELPSDVSGGPT